MKIAAKVTGAAMIALMIAMTVLTFVNAAGLVKGAAPDGEDVFAVIAGGIGAVLSMVGYMGYVLMLITGCCLCVYLVFLILSYVNLYKPFFDAHSNASFLVYTAAAAGTVMVFETVIFAFRPAAGWKPFVVLLLYTGISVAHAVLVAHSLPPEEGEEDWNYEGAPAPSPEEVPEDVRQYLPPDYFEEPPADPDAPVLKP